MKLNLLLILVILFSCKSDDNADQDSTENDQQEVMEVRVQTEDIEYEADGLQLKGFLAYDANQTGKRPGVLVVHEWWGQNEYPRSRARMLAEEGYTAFALDMYGEGKTADHPDDAGQFASEVFSNLDVAKTRFLSALSVLKSHETVDSSKIAAIGYCFGGGVVLHAARWGYDLDAVASFHGGLDTQTPAQPGEIVAEILVCNGADDPLVSEESIQSFIDEMENAGVAYTFENYPGAMHGFTNPAADENGAKFDIPLAYNEAADRQSWDKMLTFFERIF